MRHTVNDAHKPRTDVKHEPPNDAAIRRYGRSLVREMPSALRGSTTASINSANPQSPQAVYKRPQLAHFSGSLTAVLPGLREGERWK